LNRNLLIYRDLPEQRLIICVLNRRTGRILPDTISSFSPILWHEPSKSAAPLSLNVNSAMVAKRTDQSLPAEKI